MDNGKGRARDSAPSRTSLPTPDSGSSGDARGQKRKRAGARTEDGDEAEMDEEDIEARFNKYFNPNQDVDERRELKKKSRALEREFAGECEMLMRLVSALIRSRRVPRRTTP